MSVSRVALGMPECLWTLRNDEGIKITVRTETGHLSSEGYGRSLKASLVFHFYMGYYLKGEVQRDGKGDPLVDQIGSPDNPKLGSIECEWYQNFDYGLVPSSGLLAEKINAAIHIKALTFESSSKFPKEPFLNISYKSVVEFARMNRSVVQIYASDAGHMRLMFKHQFVLTAPLDPIHLPGGGVTTREAYIEHESTNPDSTYEHAFPCLLELPAEEGYEPPFHHLIADNYFVVTQGESSLFVHVKAAEKTISGCFGSQQIRWVFTAEHPEKGVLKRWKCLENPLHIFINDIVDPDDRFEGKIEEKMFQILLSYAKAIRKPIVVAPQFHFAFFLAHGFQVILEPEVVLLSFAQERYLAGECEPLKGEAQEYLVQVRKKVADHLKKPVETISDRDLANWGMPSFGALDLPEEVKGVLAERGPLSLVYYQEVDVLLKYHLNDKYLGFDPFHRDHIWERS